MSRKLTKQDFVAKATVTHGNTYDYTAVIYTTYSDKVIINCAVHGAFKQAPSKHIAGQGCPKCSLIREPLPTSEFIAKALKVHGHKYHYTKTHYTTAHSLVTITCKVHGDFQQTANNHIRGQGCPQCGNEAVSIARQDTLADFIKKATAKHGNLYKYSNVTYSDTKSPVLITCNNHGDFLQQPNSHLQGSGCPTCAGANRIAKFLHNPTMLYYFKIKNVWKVGITSRIFTERYNITDLQSITNLHTWNFSTGEEAYKYEQRIIHKYSEYAYTGSTPFTDGTGITECFTVDVYKFEKEVEDAK